MPRTFRYALLLTGVIAAGVGQPSADAADPIVADPIVFDLRQTGHEFLGFGAQIWGYNANPKVDLKQVLGDLNLRYVRVARESATWDQLRSTRAITDELGIQWMLNIWRTTDEFHREGTKMLGDVEGFAQWWADEVADFDAHGMRPSYLELMNEPDSKGDWSTGIDPQEYNALVKTLRKKLDGRGFHDVGIVGPGLTFLNWYDESNRRWISALDEEGVRSLAAWSSHTWDDGDFGRGGANVIEKQIPTYLDNAIAKDPTKPRFITEYACKETTFHGVTYPHADRFGGVDDSKELPYYSVTASIPYAARVYENTLALLNNGVQSAFIWQANDEPTEVYRKGKSWGLVDLDGRPKPVFQSLTTLCPKIPLGARVVRAPEQAEGALYAGVFVKDDIVVVAIANDDNRTASGEIILENAGGGLRVAESVGFVPLDYGDAKNGVPGKGRVVNREARLTPDNEGNYRISVELPADSTQTIVLRGG